MRRSSEAWRHLAALGPQGCDAHEGTALCTRGQAVVEKAKAQGIPLKVGPCTFFGGQVISTKQHQVRLPDAALSVVRPLCRPEPPEIT